MTRENAKSELVRLVSDPSNKVVALSGPWGTGKTHLWNEIRGESASPAIQSSLYVSLFGVKDINQLKLKVVQSALPIGGSSQTLSDALGKAYRTGVEVLKKVHPAFGAVDELALVAVPATLSGKFVVIDDIERKNASLSVDEILGFVDEYTQRFGTRMLLILNSGRLARDGDDGLWTTFREKVVDEELRFCPTPAEAFEVAVPEGASPFREAVRHACQACELTNIRVIRKVARLVDRLLGGRGELRPAIQARTIPSIVLLACIHHKAIADGPDFDFVVRFNRGRGEDWVKRYIANDPAQQEAEGADKPPAAWMLLMSKLGINSADDFEELVVAYLNEGKHDGSEISKVIDGYQADQDRIESSAAAQAFVNHCHWDPSLSDAELLAEAKAVASRASHLDAYFVTGLHQLISSLEGGMAVADQMAEAWLVEFEKRAGDADFAESPFHQPLLPRFKAAFDAARAARIDKGSLPEVVAGMVERSGWGRRDEAVMRRATAKDFEDAMRSLKGHELKLFMLKNLDIVEHGETYDRHFGEARLRFLEACRAVCESGDSPRLVKIVRKLFADSKVPRALDDGQE